MYDTDTYIVDLDPEAVIRFLVVSTMVLAILLLWVRLMSFRYHKVGQHYQQHGEYPKILNTDFLIFMLITAACSIIGLYKLHRMLNDCDCINQDLRPEIKKLWWLEVCFASSLFIMLVLLAMGLYHWVYIVAVPIPLIFVVMINQSIHRLKATTESEAGGCECLQDFYRWLHFRDLVVIGTLVAILLFNLWIWSFRKQNNVRL